MVRSYPDGGFPIFSRNTRQSFIALIAKIYEIDKIEENNFQEYRKEIKELFKRFFQNFKKLMMTKAKEPYKDDPYKNGNYRNPDLDGKKLTAFTFIKGIFEEALKPLSEVLECNMRLTLVDFQFKDLDSFEVNNFKYKALIIKFCSSYQLLQENVIKYNYWRNLKEMNDKRREEGKENEIVTESRKELIFEKNPDIYSILKKLQYDGWKHNKVEKYFIQKLQNAFLQLRVNMSKLYSMGYPYWKIPISKNEQLMEDMRAIIDLEDRLEIILGDRRKREQLNFMYEVISIIYNGPSKKKLLQKKKSFLISVIPRLVALKTLLKIHEIFQKKYVEVSEGEDFEKHEIHPPKPLLDFALMSTKSRRVVTHQMLLPPGHVYEETVELANEIGHTVRMDDNNLDELDNYGRFFMWPDYVPEEMYDEICENTKRLRDINIAVLHDLEDYIIIDGMKAKGHDFAKNNGKKNIFFKFFSRTCFQGKYGIETDGGS